VDQITLRRHTDTAYPQPIIPIYFIHSMKEPFCKLPGCWCKTDQARIALLLDAIKKGQLLLSEASDYTESKAM
jgi:hypothetical protein